MMEVSKNNIFIWLYNRGVDLTTLFFNRTRGDNIESGDGIDICKLFRRILLWTPMTLAFYGVYYFLLYHFIVLLFFTHSIALTMPILGLMLLGLIVAIGGIIGLAFLIYLCVRKTKESEIIEEYYNSIKERTCVLLRVK